jgi:NDP-sugar pyrophosphorylase family protein
MAGGFGTRLKPFTDIIPKPLIPIGKKSVIEYIIDKYREYGINNFYLSINYKARFVKAYFADLQPDYNVYYIQEDKPLGTAGSLKLLEGKIEQPFFVSNCDIVINTNYAKFYDFHISNKFDLSLVAALQKFQIPYGVCKINPDFSLIDIDEKPVQYHLINTGMYIVNPETLKLIPKGKLFHITDLMNEIIRQGGKVGVYPISQEAWIDIGQTEEFKKNLRLLLPDDVNI